MGQVEPVRAESDLVGREAELEALLAFLAMLRDGPAAFVVEGDPGIGKTALWGAAVEQWRARGVRVLVSSPAQAETKLSFASLGDLLGPVLEAVLPKLPDPQRRALRVALLLERPDAGVPDRHAISRALTTALGTLAVGETLLLAIDDSQWLDAPSEAALSFAIRRLKGLPVGLLLFSRGTTREPVDGGPAAALPEGRVLRLALGPLSVGALGRVLRLRLGSAVPRPALHRIHELSAGNPLFALELARGLRAGAVRLEPGERLPLSLDGLVKHRLAGLPRACREMLAAAAATPEPTRPLLRTITDASPERALRPAVDAEVIVVDGERIRFTHPLLASAAYSGLEPDARRRIHARLATAVSAIEERARHLALSSVRPNAAVAATLEEAAAAAGARGAPATAAELADHAVRLTPRSDEAGRRRRMAATGSYLLRAGDGEAGRAMLDDVYRCSPPGPEPTEALTRLAWAWIEADTRRAIELFERALDETTDATARVSIAHGLTWATQSAGDVRTAERHARRAARLAARIGDAELMALSRAQLLFVRAIGGRRLPWAHPARHFEEEVRRTPAAGHAAWLFGLLLAWHGDLVNAQRLVESALRETIERGDERFVPMRLTWLARVAMLQGDTQAARRHADEAQQHALEASQDVERAFTSATRAQIEARAGRADAAREAAHEALGLAERIGLANAHLEARSALGFLELSLGRVTDAYAWLHPLHADMRGAGFDDPSVFRFHPDAVEVALEVGRPDEAEELVAYLEERAQALDQRWTRAVAARCRGLVLSGASQLPQALEALQRSVDAHQDLAEPFERARTLLALGSTLRRGLQRSRARVVLGEAIGEFDRLGAPLWATRARDEERRIGGRVASTDLTPAEASVARLVAEGLTNREVAARLFVTEHTVETALVRVYAKLGVRSRSELARQMALVSSVAGSGSRRLAKLRGFPGFARQGATGMLSLMPSYLVETYLPTRRAGELEQLALRARRGAQEVTGSGTSVRFVRGVLVPDDEVCLLQFEAASSEVVETVARRAGIQYERVVAVSETANVSPEGSDGRPSRPESGRP